MIYLKNEVFSEICMWKTITLCIVLWNFYCMPWGELDTHLCLNMKRLKEQCIGESPTALSSLTRRPQRCRMSQFLIPSDSSTDPVSVSPAMGSSPSTGSAASRCSQSTGIPWCLRDAAVAFPISSARGTSLSEHGVILPLAFLLLASLMCSAIRLFALCSGSLLGHKSPVLSSYSLTFPFSNKFPHYNKFNCSF